MWCLRFSLVFLSATCLAFSARSPVLAAHTSSGYVADDTDADLKLKLVRKIDEPTYTPPRPQPTEETHPSEPSQPELQPHSSDPVPVPRPSLMSAEVVASSSFDFRWFTYTVCKKPYVQVHRTTTDVRLHVLKVLNTGLEVLGRRPAQGGDDPTLTYMCALAVGFTDAYRAMRQASRGATDAADETGIPIPVGQWFANTLKSEGGTGKKTKRTKAFYSKCSFIADRVNSILTTADYRMPAGATVSPPTALASHMNGSFDEFTDNSDKQLAHIVGHCLREKEAFKGNSWTVIHHALIQVWTSLHYMAGCAMRMLPLPEREKVALLVAQQTMLNHEQTPTFYNFLTKFQDFAATGKKSGYFPSAKDMQRSVTCGPVSPSSEEWSPTEPSITTAFLMDFSAILQQSRFESI
ncbi:UNVERIFIED_CONTAM: hypothetical protein HHA_268880 [Hammondia hammondi]|eukprot:XP_008882281.1 hypothetical protein HHA_268880 [Hammondia hammondi]